MADDPRGGRAESRLGDVGRLYDEHVAMVRRAVVRLGGPRADVDDLVHDVFVVALRRQDAFEGRAQVSTWLYGIAVKVVAGARRRDAVRRLFGLEERAIARDERTPAAAFEHRESAERLYRLLDGIAEKKRTVFVLYELEELSGEEIAAAVGCPLKTVWTRLHHARKELAARVEREEAAARRRTGGRRS